MYSCAGIYTPERINFFRLAAILHDEGRALLFLFFETFYVGKTLGAFLKEPPNKATIDRALNRNVINNGQYMQLYPLGSAPDPDPDSFDITLLVFLIRSLHPKVSVYDNVWKCPAPADTSVEACVTRLKGLRNTLWGHASKLEISAKEFSGHRVTLKLLLEQLANGIGNPSYTPQSVEERIRIKAEASMSPDAEYRLFSCLQAWRKSDDQELFIKTTEDIKQDFQKLVEAVCIKKEVRTVGTNTSDDFPASIDPVSSSCSSQDTVYEQPVSNEDSTISTGYRETTTGCLLDALKYNDVSTSTSTLQIRPTLSSRVWAFLKPFIGPSRPPTLANHQPPCHRRLEQALRKRPMRHRSSAILKCVQSGRRFRYLSKIRTDRHSHPLKCFISGIAHLMNDLLVMIDTTHNFIQVYDPWKATVDEYGYHTPIKSACAFKGTKIAVTLFQHSSVDLFEISRKCGVRYLETIRVQCESWLKDVKYVDGKLYTLCDKGEIHIHHFRSYPDDVIKLNIGVKPASFDVSVDSGVTSLYIAHKDGVLCFTDAGKELWEYRRQRQNLHDDFTQIFRHGDKLFISAWGANRVIQLTTDGEYVRDIGEGRVSNPWAVCVSSIGKHVFVSQYSVSNDNLSCREVLIFH